MPRVAVSWRSPEPSGRIAKIWSPNGLPLTGSQLDDARREAQHECRGRVQLRLTT